MFIRKKLFRYRGLARFQLQSTIEYIMSGRYILISNSFSIFEEKKTTWNRVTMKRKCTSKTKTKRITENIRQKNIKIHENHKRIEHRFTDNCEILLLMLLAVNVCICVRVCVCIAVS